jgi:lysophospholipid acyltransferase (LPLAT)-like uncharacterized protein
VTLSRRQRLEAAAIAVLGTPAIDALGATYRWHEAGADVLGRIARDGRQPIFAFWHGRILAGMLYFRDRGVVVMTSENFDGEWIARILARFGYGTARGSTSRGGSRALAQLRRDLRNGSPAAFAVDGPRGPARVAQAGAVWLASATGHPVVPLHFEAAPAWTVNSWDRHQIPKPGADVAVAIGDPIDIAPRADAEAIEAGRQAVERAIALLEVRARALLGKGQA